MDAIQASDSAANEKENTDKALFVSAGGCFILTRWRKLSPATNTHKERFVLQI